MKKASPPLLRPTVSVIIPLCNEEPMIEALQGKLQLLQQHLKEEYRVTYLFVDDGSVDRTASLLKNLQLGDAFFHILEHPRNLGVAAAFRTGFQQTSADIVCTIDADCSYGPENLRQMIQEVNSNLTDVVVASPYHPAGTVQGVQSWRRLLSSSCSSLYRILSPLKLYTYTSIFRVYRGCVIKDLAFTRNDFVGVVEMLLEAARQGYRISEVPLTLNRRSAGASKMRVVRTVRGHLGLMLHCITQRWTEARVPRRETDLLASPLSSEPDKRVTSHRMAGL